MLAEAFEFPEINAILRWDDIFPSFNKIALIAVASRADRHRRLPARRPARTRRSRRRACATSPRPRSSSSRTASSCRRWARTGSGGRRSCSACSSSSTCATCPASSRSCRCRPRPASRSRCSSSLLVWVIYIGVGFKHQGIGYLDAHALAARRARRAEAARRRHRVHLDHHRPAVLAHRPTLRQHARRPHPARHLRAADAGADHGRDDAVRCSSRWRSCRSSCWSS